VDGAAVQGSGFQPAQVLDGLAEYEVMKTHFGGGIAKGTAGRRAVHGPS
jgi:hypothetical protein